MRTLIKHIKHPYATHSYSLTKVDRDNRISYELVKDKGLDTKFVIGIQADNDKDALKIVKYIIKYTY